MRIRRALAAPDKFKGTASAADVAMAIGHACWEQGVECVERPMADGGDGLLEALGGPNRRSTVTGPNGKQIDAAWRFSKGTAVIEMARASGLVLAGGAEANDALTATTAGTGELIDHALDAGAKRIIVGLGGSATTDGGLGALDAIASVARLRGVELLVACDVTTRFVDAAEVFGPQKGARPAEVRMLTGRLERLAEVYQQRFGTDITDVAGGGAAGGLGGALAALGGRLLPGCELVADELDLYDVFESGDSADSGPGVDLVITGEGLVDATSTSGKVVGWIEALAAEYGVPVLVVAGDVDDAGAAALAPDTSVLSLTELFGSERAHQEPKWCTERAVSDWLSRQPSGH